MDALTVIGLGSTLIRGIGKLIGGKTEQVAENVAFMADQVKALPAAVATEKLNQAMAKLPIEDLLELKKIENKAAEIEKEREVARLNAETAQQAQRQATRRTEVQSGDAYVRRTRPTLARHSAMLTFFYLIITGIVFPVINVLIAAFSEAKLQLPGPNEWLVMAMFSPCLSYMGARSFDAFSRWGKT